MKQLVSTLLILCLAAPSWAATDLPRALQSTDRIPVINTGTGNAYNVTPDQIKNYVGPGTTDYNDLTNKPTLPATKSAITHYWLNSYASGTGLFTASQPDYSDLTGTPTLGTAASRNVPASGNAASNEVVLGSDTRLSGGGYSTYAQIVTATLAVAPRHVWMVYGDSTDGGTTPDATTQASMDALVAAGVPLANIRWLYEAGAGAGGGTFTVANLVSGSTIENVPLTQRGGVLSIGDMVVASTIDGVTITNPALNVFTIDDMASASTVDNVTLVLAGGTLAVADMAAASAIENVTITAGVPPATGVTFISAGAMQTADSQGNYPVAVPATNPGDFILLVAGNVVALPNGLASGNATDWVNVTSDYANGRGIFYKFSPGSAATTVTVAGDGTDVYPSPARAFVFRGVNASTPLDQKDTTYVTASSVGTTVTGTAFSGLAADSMVAMVEFGIVQNATAAGGAADTFVAGGVTNGQLNVHLAYDSTAAGKSTAPTITHNANVNSGYKFSFALKH